MRIVPFPDSRDYLSTYLSFYLRARPLVKGLVFPFCRAIRPGPHGAREPALEPCERVLEERSGIGDHGPVFSAEAKPQRRLIARCKHDLAHESQDWMGRVRMQCARRRAAEWLPPKN